MNKSHRYNQQGEPGVKEVQEMYLPKVRNWPYISENTGAMLENLSKETISESSQIKE